MSAHAAGRPQRTVCCAARGARGGQAQGEEERLGLGAIRLLFFGKKTLRLPSPLSSFWACSGRGAGAALAYNRRKGAPRERRLISPWGFQSTG